jgi:hypothetical protein
MHFLGLFLEVFAKFSIFFFCFLQAAGSNVALTNKFHSSADGDEHQAAAAMVVGHGENTMKLNDTDRMQTLLRIKPLTDAKENQVGDERHLVHLSVYFSHHCTLTRPLRAPYA